MVRWTPGVVRSASLDLLKSKSSGIQAKRRVLTYGRGTPVALGFCYAARRGIFDRQTFRNKSNAISLRVSIAPYLCARWCDVIFWRILTEKRKTFVNTYTRTFFSVRSPRTVLVSVGHVLRTVRVRFLISRPWDRRRPETLSFSRWRVRGPENVITIERHARLRETPYGAIRRTGGN